MYIQQGWCGMGFIGCLLLSFSAGWLLRDVTLKSYLFYLDGFRDCILEDYSIVDNMPDEYLEECGMIREEAGANDTDSGSKK